MAGRSQRHEQLQRELLALGDDAMLIEEFDGFVAGLLVCPEMISPNEWLPLIWNREGQTEQSPLQDVDHANRLFGLIMETYNDVVLTLMNRPRALPSAVPGRCAQRRHHLGDLGRGVCGGCRLAPGVVAATARGR